MNLCLMTTHLKNVESRNKPCQCILPYGHARCFQSNGYHGNTQNDARSQKSTFLDTLIIHILQANLDKYVIRLFWESSSFKAGEVNIK